MINHLAQEPINIGGPFRGFGQLGLVDLDAWMAPLIFNKFISSVIGLLTLVAFVWFIIQFFVGAIGIIASGGDKAKLSEARTKIGTSVVGLVVVIVAIFIISLIGYLLNVDILGAGLYVDLLKPR